MAKTARPEPTREGLRFHWLILQLLERGVSGAELSRVTGVRESHINAFKNIHTSGRSGIGAEIVRFMSKGLGLRPDYFFRDYPHRHHPKSDAAGKPWRVSCKICQELGILEEDDFRLYLFAGESEKAEARRLQALMADVEKLRAKADEVDELKRAVSALTERLEGAGFPPPGKRKRARF